MCYTNLKCAIDSIHIRLSTSCSPARQDDRLCSLAGLPSNASHVGEVCAPLPAVEAVLPELSHTHTLNAPQNNAFSLCPCY